MYVHILNVTFVFSYVLALKKYFFATTVNVNVSCNLVNSDVPCLFCKNFLTCFLCLKRVHNYYCWHFSYCVTKYYFWKLLGRKCRSTVFVLLLMLVLILTFGQFSTRAYNVCIREKVFLLLCIVQGEGTLIFSCLYANFLRYPSLLNKDVWTG
jgi:hypothetical protein